MKKQFDYETANLIGEVKYDLRAISPIRSSIFQLANELANGAAEQGFVLLVDSSISRARINEEWSMVQNTLHPDIAARLHIFLNKGDRFWGWPNDPGEEMSAHLIKAVKQDLAATSTKLPQADYFSVILKILLLDYLGPSSRKPEKLTMKRMGELAGCSYPTVSSSLDRLQPYLMRSYSHGIRLKRFPFEEWHSMILSADKVRATMRFVDKSGQRRRPSQLLERLTEMQLEQVGVGGVFGAMEFYPDLDITGDPRIYLSIHAPGNSTNIDFVQKIDPALVPIKDPTETGQLVLHFVRSDRSFFSHGSGGIRTASWVECMLDLHEMRSGTQADQWLNAWLNEKESNID
jgi:hypothetical protein